MAKHTFSIGEIVRTSSSKTAAKEAAISDAARICRDGVLTPTIVWGCPGQDEPIVVAALVNGWGTYRPGPVTTGVYTSREQAIASAVTNMAQNAWGARVDVYGPYYDAEPIAAWIRSFDRENALLAEASRDFVRWVTWQRGYAVAKHDNPDGGDEAWRRAAEIALNGYAL